MSLSLYFTNLENKKKFLKFIYKYMEKYNLHYDIHYNMGDNDMDVDIDKSSHFTYEELSPIMDKFKKIEKL